MARIAEIAKQDSALADKDEQIAALEATLASPHELLARHLAAQEEEIAALRAAVAAAPERGGDDDTGPLAAEESDAESVDPQESDRGCDDDADFADYQGRDQGYDDDEASNVDSADSMVESSFDEEEDSDGADENEDPKEGVAAVVFVSGEPSEKKGGGRTKDSTDPPGRVHWFDDDGASDVDSTDSSVEPSFDEEDEDSDGVDENEDPNEEVVEVVLDSKEPSEKKGDCIRASDTDSTDSTVEPSFDNEEESNSADVNEDSNEEVVEVVLNSKEPSEKKGGDRRKEWNVFGLA